MRLSIQQSRDLLEEYGVFANSVCDRCGLILGPVRYTRKDDSGEWCSRNCRDGADAHEPKTCRHCKAKLPEGKRRGAAFCDDACRKAAKRQSGLLQSSQTDKLSRTKPSIYAGLSSGKEAVGISGHPDARRGRKEGFEGATERGISSRGAF